MEDIDPISSTNDQVEQDLSVFPNPVTDKLVILNTDVQDWILFTIDGASLIRGQGQEVDMTNMGQGVYILVGQTPSGAMRARIIKP